MQMETQHSSRFIRLPEVKQKTGLPAPSIYRMIGQGQFPKPLKLAAKSVAWVDTEIEAWMQERKEARDTA